MPLCETSCSARCSDPSVCIVVPTMASTISATLALSSQESRETVRMLSRSGHVLVLGRADLGLACRDAASTQHDRAERRPSRPSGRRGATNGPPKSGPAIAPIGRPDVDQRRRAAAPRGRNAADRPGERGRPRHRREHAGREAQARRARRTSRRTRAAAPRSRTAASRRSSRASGRSGRRGGRPARRRAARPRCRRRRRCPTAPCSGRSVSSQPGSSGATANQSTRSKKTSRADEHRQPAAPPRRTPPRRPLLRSGQQPVDRLGALLGEQRVGARERLASRRTRCAPRAGSDARSRCRDAA